MKDLFITAATVLKMAARTGKVLATKGEVETRLQTCRGCEHLKNSRCTACGCLVALKAGLVAADCPENRW